MVPELLKIIAKLQHPRKTRERLYATLLTVIFRRTGLRPKCPRTLASFIETNATEEDYRKALQFARLPSKLDEWGDLVPFTPPPPSPIGVAASDEAIREWGYIMFNRPYCPCGSNNRTADHYAQCATRWRWDQMWRAGYFHMTKHYPQESKGP